MKIIKITPDMIHPELRDIGTSAKIKVHRFLSARALGIKTMRSSMNAK